jgi:hypothetical protein
MLAHTLRTQAVVALFRTITSTLGVREMRVLIDAVTACT